MALVLRRFILATAALTAAVVAYAVVSAPAPRTEFRPIADPTVLVGAYHVHTTNSDGQATPAAAAAAARRAGRQFLVLTDHGDATRPPMPPAYVDGVLVIDAVEISSVEGHIVALGLPGPAPYRLAGEARDVIDDVHRLGGFAVVAHPDSPRADLRWRPASGTAGRNGGAIDIGAADGLEWLNADSERRDDRWPALLQTLLTLSVRPAESFTMLFRRPVMTLRRWDALAARRTTLGLAAVDAHGVAGGRLYAESFAAVAQAVRLSAPANGDAAHDAALVIDALRSGRTWSVLTGIGSPVAPTLEMADADGHRASMGERLDAHGPIEVRAQIPGADHARLSLWHNGDEVAIGRGSVTFQGPGDPGGYRLEATLDANDRLPWVVTNPVYLQAPETPTPSPTPVQRALLDELVQPFVAGDDWRIEHGPSSSGAVTGAGDVVQFDYRIGTQRPGLEYAALVRPLWAPASQAGQTAEAFDRLEFTASADKPMRISVQFRLPGGREDERWARSVYVSPTPQAVTVRLADVVPVGFQATRRPVVARIQSVLFVIDTMNTAPGASGTVTLTNITLRRTKRDEPESGPNLQQQIPGAGQEQQVGRPGRQGRR